MAALAEVVEHQALVVVVVLAADGSWSAFASRRSPATSKLMAAMARMARTQPQVQLAVVVVVVAVVVASLDSFVVQARRLRRRPQMAVVAAQAARALAGPEEQAVTAALVETVL